jgi:hypothetical protein
MTTIFLRIFEFIFGIKHKTPKERAAAGEKLIVEAIFSASASMIKSHDVESIWLVGSIDFNEDQLSRVKEKLLNGENVTFSESESFDFAGDYIDFYQIDTKDKRHFIIAMSDFFMLQKKDKPMFFVELQVPYPTDCLKAGSRFYPYSYPDLKNNSDFHQT